MSTRANIVLKESYSYEDMEGKKSNVTNELIFYRHSDGYPEGTLPTLNIFMDWLKRGKIRNSIYQAGGWLIIIGAMEYNTLPEFKKVPAYEGSEKFYGDEKTFEDPKDWKCGAYEPTYCIHTDIEYLYEIDIIKKTLAVKIPSSRDEIYNITSWETINTF